MTALSGRRLSVVLAVVLLTGALVALGLSQATAQDNPNSQPSASKAADDGSGSVQTSSTVQKKVLWAVVNRDGTLARDRGARDANRLGGGNYEVLFDRNVRSCVYTATIGLSEAVGTEESGEITVVGRFGARNGVFITTHNSSGTPANREFHLALNCPV